MRTVVLGEPPADFQALLDRRRRLGQDRYDEVWEGTYVMAPAPRQSHAAVQTQLVRLLAEPAQAAGLTDTGPFNLGDPDDFRVPDLGYHRSMTSATFVPTAPIVVEVLSPDDETYAKFGFYAAHGVEEILVADPTARTVCWWRSSGCEYTEAVGSEVLGISAAGLAADVRWP